jgi:hypothetical protein
MKTKYEALLAVNPAASDDSPGDAKGHARRRLAALTVAVALLAAGETAFGTAAEAHNRAHIILPTGTCMIVGSETSVQLPDGTYLDLYPQDGPYPNDEYGTSFAALQGSSAIEKGPCP